MIRYRKDDIFIGSLNKLFQFLLFLLFGQTSIITQIVLIIFNSFYTGFFDIFQFEVELKLLCKIYVSTDFLLQL